jgi:CRISPR-associated protein Cmr4
LTQQVGRQSPLLGFPVLGYAVTPLHPGVGRAPGAVDLPVQRDPMGYPIVYASSVKGALKAECARQAGGVDCFDRDSGRIKCDDERCALCCCLFGREPGSEETASSLLSVLDLVPLFFPVPSLSHGYLYITTPYLARRAYAILEAAGAPGELGKLAELLNTIAGSRPAEGAAKGCIEGEVYIVTDKLRVEKLGDCSGLNAVKKLGGLAGDMDSRLIVVSDADGPLYVEKGLIRVTRVRLKLHTKTVETGGLWTEEYIPEGTVFLGGFIAAVPKKNKYCAIARGTEPEEGSDVVLEDAARELVCKLLERLQQKNSTFYAVIGGKETIGRGLIKFIIPQQCSTS